MALLPTYQVSHLTGLGVRMPRQALVASLALVIGLGTRATAQGSPNAGLQQSTLDSSAASATDSVIQAHQVRVVANNDEWTATGLYVKAGDCFMIFTGEAKIRIGPSLGEVDANGTSNGLGMLKGKIGTSTVFPVGRRTTFCNPERGVLKLKVSDTKYEDNSGEYSVMLIRVPGKMIPTPEPFLSDE